MSGGVTAAVTVALGAVGGPLAAAGGAMAGITPNPKLTGFEIVVASSNNGAVENVSKEIPGPKGIDGQWRDAAAVVNYFSQTAGHDAWAMVAARLGNRANRAAFARDFSFNSDLSMRNVLRQPAALPSDWQDAVASFRRALSRVKDLSAERSVVSHSIIRLPVASRDRAQADADLESAIAPREKFEAEQRDADRLVYRCYTSIALAPGRSPKRALASRLRIIRPVSAACAAMIRSRAPRGEPDRRTWASRRPW